MPGCRFVNFRLRPSCTCLRRTLDVLLPLVIIGLIYAISIHNSTLGRSIIWSFGKSAGEIQNPGNVKLMTAKRAQESDGLLAESDLDIGDTARNGIHRLTLIQNGEQSTEPMLNTVVKRVLNGDNVSRVRKVSQLLRNITKEATDHKLFSQIPEEAYLKENKSFFEIKESVHNVDQSYSFLISGESVCQESPFLLVVIPSVIDHRDMREAIRRTWLKAAETDSWPRANVAVRIKHIFLFGYDKSSKSHDFRRLLHESAEHKDVVMVDFEDSYRNLTIKILSGLRWMVSFCPRAEFLLKVDEDTFINAPLMTELLLHVRQGQRTGKYVLGLKHAYGRPEVVRHGKWAVSKEEYPLDYYPHYLYGHTYAISRLGVSELLDKSKYARIIAPEDAYITGILPKISGILRLDAPSFTVCCRLIYDCEVVWNRRVAMTAVVDTKTLNQLWANILVDACDNEVAFIDGRSR